MEWLCVNNKGNNMRYNSVIYTWILLLNQPSPFTTKSRAPNHCSNTLIQLYKFTHTHSQSYQKLELQSQQSQILTLPKINKDKVSCYTMTLNPLNNNILAVGCRDKWIRLYDRRTLTVGNGKNAKPYMLLTQHSLLHKQN
eukprot:312742_1